MSDDDPWKDWKKNPVGNALALLAVIVYVVCVGCIFAGL